MKISGFRLFVGIFLLIIGIAALFSALGVEYDINIFSIMFSVLIILFAIYCIYQSRSFIWPGVILLAGIWMLLKSLNLIPEEYHHLFWPGLLIIGALALIFRSIFPRRNIKLITGDSENMPEYFCAFGGSKVSNTAHNFTKAAMTVLFGGIEADFSQAQIALNEAVIDCFVMFGGIDIVVPKDWNVVINAIPVFGGFDSKASGEGAGKTLRIKGIVLFGGVEIKN